MTSHDAATILIDSLDRDYTNLDGTWTDRDAAIDFLINALQAERKKIWEQAAVDLSHGLPPIWKKALIDRCLFKANECRKQAKDIKP